MSNKSTMVVVALMDLAFAIMGGLIGCMVFHYFFKV